MSFFKKPITSTGIEVSTPEQDRWIGGVAAFVITIIMVLYWYEFILPLKPKKRIETNNDS